MVATALVSLKDWAKHNEIPYRTALHWAKQGKIPAEMSERKVQVVQTKRTRGYIINPLVQIPGNMGVKKVK